MPKKPLGITRAQTPIDKMDTESITYTELRKIIEDIEQHPNFPKLQYLLKISYLYGLRFGEILKKYRLKGNDFSQEVINGKEALVVTVPTSKRGGRPRQVAVPLNPKYEPWTKEILDFSEENYNKILFTRDISGVGRWLRNKTFENYTYYQSGGIRDDVYSEPKPKRVTPTHFRDIRACELALLYNFTKFDILNYLGYVARPEYLSYFNKLLDRRDIYSKEDIIESLKINYLIFNPSEQEKYDFTTYMNIAKLLKKGLLTKNTSQVNILSLPLPTSIGKDRQDHRRLKANGAKMLENMKSKNISYEIANLDVYSYDLGIAIECGKSDGNKLLDFYNNSYQGIENYQEFWVLEYYDENHISRLHKYKLTQAPEAER